MTKGWLRKARLDLGFRVKGETRLHCQATSMPKILHVSWANCVMTSFDLTPMPIYREECSKPPEFQSQISLNPTSFWGMLVLQTKAMQERVQVPNNQILAPKHVL